MILYFCVNCLERKSSVSYDNNFLCFMWILLCPWLSKERKQRFLICKRNKVLSNCTAASVCF